MAPQFGTFKLQKLVIIKTRVEDDKLVLSCKDMPDMLVPLTMEYEQDQIVKVKYVLR